MLQVLINYRLQTTDYRRGNALASMRVQPATCAFASRAIFSRAEIEEYERRILTNPRASERTASAFFKKHPKFLHLGSAADIRHEVVMVTEGECPNRRVDFFRRRFGSQFWDIVELKHPRASFVRGVESLHPSNSAAVDRAISQALDYRDLIITTPTLRSELLRKGIRVLRPQILVVVGQNDDEIDPDIIHLVSDRIRQRGGVEAWSYTDILEFAKEHYERSRGGILLPFAHVATVAQPNSVDVLIREVVSKPKWLSSLAPHEFQEAVAVVLKANLEPSLAVAAATPLSENGKYYVELIADMQEPFRGLVECLTNVRQVGVDIVAEFLKRRSHYAAGVIATTGYFTRDAAQLAKGSLLLRDQRAVLKWFRKYAVS